MERKVLIIGGGAAGMTAAIMAARQGARVTVLEHTDRVGRKLLSTGNGRCNFTNTDQKPEYYRCTQEDFPWQTVSRFPVSDTLRFFAELGIPARSRGSCLYPNSEQAASVLDALRMELDRQCVDVRTGCRVRTVKRQNGAFAAETDGGTFRADAVILASGSRAAPHTGSDGSGYELARALGHRIITPLPALVQLRCAENDYKQMAGVRADARVELYTESGGSWRLEAADRGELQLTDYGISGIPVFQVSRFASAALHRRKRVKAVIDFLPDKSEAETREMIAARCGRMQDNTCEQWMNGLLHKKLAVVLLKRAGLRPSQRAGDVPPSGWEALYRQLRAFETAVTAANSFDQAQVCCGGVDTAQVDAVSMESKLVPDLYFAGEILDVDGICGGYNLQWAWSSGAVAGRSAAGGKDDRQRKGQIR